MVGSERWLDVGSDRLDVSYRELQTDGTSSPVSQVTLRISAEPQRERPWLLPLGSPLIEAAAILAGQDAGWRDFQQVSGPIQWAAKVLWHYGISMAITLLICGAGRGLPPPTAALSAVAARADRLATVCVLTGHSGLDRLSLFAPLAGAGELRDVPCAVAPRQGSVRRLRFRLSASRGARDRDFCLTARRRRAF